jgi:hypothetical protein
MSEPGPLTIERIESAIVTLMDDELEFVTWEHGERPWLQLVVEENAWLTVNASAGDIDPRPRLEPAGVTDIAPDSVQWESGSFMTFTLALDMEDEVERLLAVDHVLRLLENVLSCDLGAGWREEFS